MTWRFHNYTPTEGGQVRGGADACFGGDEKFASERGSNQPRSPSQASGMIAWRGTKGKEIAENRIVSIRRRIMEETVVLFRWDSILI